MRPLLCVGLLLSFAGCALFESSGQRYVVFFRGSSAQMDDAAEAVLVGAANWAKKHPDMPVTVGSYADPYGSEKANADFTRLSAQAVVEGLVANGVTASRIQRREIGSVKFQSDPQESPSETPDQYDLSALAVPIATSTLGSGRTMVG